MIISDVELFAIELPASDEAVHSLLVRVTTQRGGEGWGETRLSARPRELPARAKGLTSLLAGREAYDVEAILAIDMLADRELACGVEMALWDLIARAARLPLCDLWGGGYRTSVPLAVALPEGEIEAVVHWARALAAQAIATQTIRASGQVDDDLRLVTACRDACAHRVQFRLDAAERYDLGTLGQLCEALPPGSLECLIDPVPAKQLELLSAARFAAAAPFALHRALESPADVARAIQWEAAHSVLIDPARVGGLARARECAVVAAAGGLSPALALDGTSGLAVAATLQLATATPALAAAQQCAYPKLHDDVLTQSLRTFDGMLAVPLGPGLGVEVSRDQVERYQVTG